MKKSIARKFKMGGGLEGNEFGGLPGQTKRSKEIKKGIKNKSDKEKQDIIKRNMPAYNVGKLQPGQKYRKDMPESLQDIALRSDSVRAAFHSLIPLKKTGSAGAGSAFKMKGFGGFGNSPAKQKYKVTGTPSQDRQANKESQMSYTDEYANKARKQLASDQKAIQSGKFNLKTDPDGKNKKGQMNYSDLQDRRRKNKNVLRAYRDQQKMLKATGKTTL